MPTIAVTTPPVRPPSPTADTRRQGADPGLRRRIAQWLEENRRALVPRLYEAQFDPGLVSRYAIAGVDSESRASLEHHYLNPLLRLLIGYAWTGESRFKEVYLDERLRYAPHQAAPAQRLAFFDEVLHADEQAILRTAGRESALALAVVAFLQELHAPLVTRGDSDRVHLLAVGDCLMNELRVFLPGRCREHGIDLDMRCLYFSASQGRSVGTAQVAQRLTSSPPDLIACSFFSYQGLPPYAALLREADDLGRRSVAERVAAVMNTVRAFCDDLRRLVDTPFLIHNVSGLPLTPARHHVPILPPLSRGRKRLVEALNEAVSDLVTSMPNALLLDEWQVTAARGHRRCARSLLPKAVAKDAFFHTSRFGDYLAEPYTELVRSYRDLRKAKVLLVDFDNTLWDGVMAEGPVHHNHAAQALLRQLREAGMLLVALSKNDPGSVRWEEMVLQPSDFVLQKISWNLKVQSIQEAAEALNLGMDSFVLIDDSPAERDLVHSQLPLVRVLNAADPYTWRALARLLAFPNTRDTEEARARTEAYRAQALRHEAKTAALDYPAMMASLQLRARFGRAREADLKRISELVQRTNQFNTTTIRYSWATLHQFLKSPGHAVYVAELADKFGEFGLVAVAIITRQADDAVFEAFVMSCRAIGVGLENLVVQLVLAEERASRFIGHFVPTDRNGPATGLFAENGFTRIGETEWLFDGSTLRPDPPPWIRVLRR
jgi:FkbH-like protein